MTEEHIPYQSNPDLDPEEDSMVRSVTGLGETGLAKYDYGMIAAILLDARLDGRDKAVQKYGLHPSTIDLWRKEGKTNPALQKAIAQKNREYSEDFAVESAQAIKSCLDFIHRAATQADPDDKAMVRAIAGAMKMAGEFRLALDITYSSLGRGPSASPALPAGDTYEIEPQEAVIEGKFEEGQVQELTEE